MPTLPSPPSTTSANATPGHTRLANGHRASTAASQSRTSTPKQTSGSGTGGLRSAKVRGSSDKENGSDASSARAARRGSSANVLAGREKMPSKDGTVQKHAKGVEGLKDYVCWTSFILQEELRWDEVESVLRHCLTCLCTSPIFDVSRG